MKPVIADTSAVLAYIDQEPGWEVVNQHLPQIQVSAVNMTEAVTVLTLRGSASEWIERHVFTVFPEVLPYNPEEALNAGFMVINTKRLGLSLGDRACLATALLLGATVLTTDSAWAKLDLGVDIRLLRLPS